MLKIEIYRLLDELVCTIDSSSVIGVGEPQQHTLWTNLAYVKGEQLAHDEGGMLEDLIARAVEVADERVGGLGGWGLLT